MTGSKSCFESVSPLVLLLELVSVLKLELVPPLNLAPTLLSVDV